MRVRGRLPTWLAGRDFGPLPPSVSSRRDTCGGSLEEARASAVLPPALALLGGAWFSGHREPVSAPTQRHALARRPGSAARRAHKPG